MSPIKKKIPPHSLNYLNSPSSTFHNISNLLQTLKAFAIDLWNFHFLIQTISISSFIIIQLLVTNRVHNISTFLIQYNFHLKTPLLHDSLFDPSNPSKLVLKKKKNHVNPCDNPKPRPITKTSPPSFRLIQPCLRKTFAPLLLFLSIGSLADGHNPRLLHHKTAKRAREAARRVFFRVLDS